MFSNFASSIFPRLLNLAVVSVPYLFLHLWRAREVYDGWFGITLGYGPVVLLLAAGLFGMWFGFFHYYDSITREWVIGTKVESFRALGWALFALSAAGVTSWFGANKAFAVGTLGGAASPTLSWRRNAYKPPGVFALTVLQLYFLSSFLLFVLAFAIYGTGFGLRSIFTENSFMILIVAELVLMLIPVAIIVLCAWGIWSLLKSSFAVGLGVVAWVKSYTEEGAAFRHVYGVNHDLASDLCQHTAQTYPEAPSAWVAEATPETDIMTGRTPRSDVLPDNACGESNSPASPKVAEDVTPPLWSIVVSDGRSQHTYTRESAEAAQLLASSLSPGWSFEIIPPGEAKGGLQPV